MTAVLAGASGTSHLISTVQSVPLVLIYLAAVAIFVLVAIKTGGAAWHHLVAGLILGVMSIVAIPAGAAKLSGLSGTRDRVLVDAILVIVMLATVIMTFVDSKKK